MLCSGERSTPPEAVHCANIFEKTPQNEGLTMCSSHNMPRDQETYGELSLNGKRRPGLLRTPMEYELGVKGARRKEQILQRDKYVFSPCLVRKRTPSFSEQNSESSPWPTGLHDLVLASVPRAVAHRTAHSLCCSHTGLLIVPNTYHVHSCLRAFAAAVPSAWNVHPKAHSLTSFRSPFSSPETPSVPSHCLIFLPSAYHNPPHINLLWVSPQ